MSEGKGPVHVVLFPFVHVREVHESHPLQLLRSTAYVLRSAYKLHDCRYDEANPFLTGTWSSS